MRTIDKPMASLSATEYLNIKDSVREMYLGGFEAEFHRPKSH